MAPSAPIRPSIALAAFAEKFIEGRRVLVFGNALSSFWEQLIERGARLVHVCDSDASRVAEAAARNTSQHVSFAPLSGSGLAVRDGAFDVGFIDNLAAHGDPGQTVHKLKRALSTRGVALVSAPNPDLEQPLVGAVLEPGQKLDYYSLYDLVHREFPVVRMVGQMPFVGYSVAELAPAEDPEPCLDAGFVPGGTEEPEWFVAVASHVDVEFDPFLVVQLSCDTLLKNGTERVLREQLRTARSAERGAVERLARLEAEQRKHAEATERLQKDVDLARQIRLLQEELERKESWILQLEARAATADARADDADQELDELRAQLDSGRDARGAAATEAQAKLTAFDGERQALRCQIEQSQQELAAIRQRLLETVSNRDSAATKLAELEREKRALETERQELKAQLAAIEAERTRTETALKVEQQARKAQLETAEAERERTAAALNTAQARAAELEARVGQTDPELEVELGRLESQLAERGERVRKLEGELAKTERLGARLLRELERARTLAYQATPVAAGQTSAATSQPEEISAGEAAAIAIVSNESWTQGPTLTAATTTEQNPAEVSAWAELPATGTAELEELRSKLDRLAALAARQQADLNASQWRIEQIQAENEALREYASQNETLSNELSTVRSRLQETEVLLAQLRWREATASDVGPAR